MFHSTRSHGDRTQSEHPDVVHVHKGPSFILPPRDRLFCVFDRREDGVAAIRDLLHLDSVSIDDVWVFEGERGAGRLDPTLVRHGVRTLLGRVVQRLLTGDADYGDGLVKDLRRGGIVLAIHTTRHDVSTILPTLEQHGAHSTAFGTHWNYVEPTELTGSKTTS
jgi:hypothetical protein